MCVCPWHRLRQGQGFGFASGMDLEQAAEIAMFTLVQSGRDTDTRRHERRQGMAAVSKTGDAEPGEGRHWAHHWPRESRGNQGAPSGKGRGAIPQEHLCPGRLEPRTDPSLGAGRGAQRGAHSAVTVLWMAVGSFVPGSL